MFVVKLGDHNGATLRVFASSLY